MFRVLHLTPALFGRYGVYGGAERYTLELAKAMARVVPTSLVAFGDSPTAYRTSEGLSVRVLGPVWRIRGQRFNPIHHGIVRAVAQADIIHVHQPHTFAAEVVALLARATGRKVFASDLGGGGWGFSSRFNTNRWFHGHLHISDYCRTITDHTANPRARVIYGGIDTEIFSPDARVAKEPLVVFVGRLMPHKGIDDLIRALPPGLTLELIGRPYDERYLLDLKHLADGKNVQFRHDCDDTEIVNAYRRAVCVVLPSVYRDCYGNVTKVPELLGQTLLEGMACATPTIGTRVASLPEVVVDDETGFLVPPNDSAALRLKLERLRDHPADIERFGQAGRQRILDRFTWPTVVVRCLAAYRNE